MLTPGAKSGAAGQRSSVQKRPQVYARPVITLGDPAVAMLGQYMRPVLTRGGRLASFVVRTSTTTAPTPAGPVVLGGCDARV